jgi:hypothetical protein
MAISAKKGACNGKTQKNNYKEDNINKRKKSRNKGNAEEKQPLKLLPQ